MGLHKVHGTLQLEVQFSGKQLWNASIVFCTMYFSRTLWRTLIQGRKCICQIWRTRRIQTGELTIWEYWVGNEERKCWGLTRSWSQPASIQRDKGEGCENEGVGTKLESGTKNLTELELRERNHTGRCLPQRDLMCEKQGHTEKSGNSMVGEVPRERGTGPWIKGRMFFLGWQPAEFFLASGFLSP